MKRQYASYARDRSLCMSHRLEFVCVFCRVSAMHLYIYQIRHLGKWQYRPANIIIAYIRRRFAVLFALEISYVARVCCDFFSRLLQCSQAIVRSFVLCLVLSPTLVFFSIFFIFSCATAASFTHVAVWHTHEINKYQRTASQPLI